MRPRVPSARARPSRTAFLKLRDSAITLMRNATNANAARPSVNTPGAYQYPARRRHQATPRPPYPRTARSAAPVIERMAIVDERLVVVAAVGRRVAVVGEDV